MAMVSPGVTGIEFTRPQADVPNAPQVFYPNNCKRNFARLAPADDLEHATLSDWPNQLTAKGRQWYQAYVSQFGTPPDIHALYGYEAMNVVFSAIERAGSANRAAIRDALISTSNFDGVLGTWSMTSTGDTTRIQAPTPGSR
jgi:ABC-type branched-subunit amino acid transport system substrate-binding protein